MTASRHLLRSLVALLGAFAVATSLAACGGATDVASAESIEILGAEVLPETLLDLEVVAEDASMVDNKKDESFVEAMGLYSLRRDDLLQGVFQISRFMPEARLDDPSFRRQIVEQIGSTTPQAYRMGDQTVYLTTGRRQSVAVWFNGRHLFVLSTRDEYETPRGLLRRALEIRP